MTNEELQEVVAAVIAALKTNGKTIDQLTAVTALADTDNLEISGGKKVAFGKLKELVASSVVITEESIKGWVPIESTEDLPEEPTPEEQEKAYIIAEDSMLYVYVGEGGDTLDGLYQSVELQGPQGETGPAGADGHDGVDLGEVALINDLTTGGEGAALSAEQGKRLAQVILGGEGIRETIPCNALSIKGGYYSSSNSGQIVSSNSYKYTNKINISNILRIDVTGSYQTKVLFWGEDGTTYLGYTSTAVVKKEDFPTGAAYCAMNYADTSTANIVIDYSFEPYILDIQKGGLGYAKLVLPIGKYNLTASTGEQAYDSTWNGVLGFVPLYGAISVYVPENGSAQGVICFYDENFTYLEGSAYTQYKIVPSGAKYCKIRVASGTLAYTNVDVYLYGAKLEPLNAFENTRKAIGKISPKCLIGKTVAFLGDSITAANLFGLYTRRFADISGATITNYAVGGKCYAGDEIAGQAASLTGTEDVVVMMGGTNDFNQSKVIGDIYIESGGTITAPSSTTFCGGLHDAIQAVYAKCPTAQVVIITPPQKGNGWTANSAGKYLYEYADAIKKVAQLYAIPVVDQFANCGINPVMSAMKSAYFNSDGTHPNNTYHMLLAKWLYNAIATWVKEPYD